MKKWIATLCAAVLLATSIFGLQGCAVNMELKDPDDYVPGDVDPEINATLPRRDAQHDPGGGIDGRPRFRVQRHLSECGL